MPSPLPMRQAPVRLLGFLRVLPVLLSMALGAAEPGGGPPPGPLAPTRRPESTPADPNVTQEQATRLNDEIADSLGKRFRSEQRARGDTIESENVLARPVKPVVVDEMKAWRAQFDSAVKNYEQSTDADGQKAAENLLIGILTNPDAPVNIQRDCLKQLASIALDGRFYGRAQQIYSQLVSRFPLHPDTPSVLLRQGVLYRRVGANELALSKFHAVMSTVLSLPEKDISAYKALVLVAQTEIADTFFISGQFERATEYFRRVLKLADEDLNEAQVRLKLVKSFFEIKDWKNVIVEGQQCIERIALTTQIAEVRFLMAEAYKQLGMHREALQQTMALLNSEQARSSKDPANWAYWQKRTGNKLANELYQQGDYLNALLIYQTLEKLPGDEEWRSQALYQMGLIYERLEQNDRAIAVYSQLVTALAAPPATSTNAPATPQAGPATAGTTAANASTNAPAPANGSGDSAGTADRATPARSGEADAPKAAAGPSPGLKLIREMAAWRLQNLQWDQGVNRELRNLSMRALSTPDPLPGAASTAVTPPSTNRPPGQGTTRP